MKKGFFLYELLLASTIVTFFTLCFFSTFNFSSKTVLGEQVELLEKLFVYLQLKAMSTQKNYTLIFDCINNSYCYEKNNGGKNIVMLPPSLRFGTHDELLGPPSHPEHTITKPITFPEKAPHIYEVTFFPSMTISSGSVYLYNKQQKQTKALTVAIDSIALFRKYNYENKQWKKYE